MPTLEINWEGERGHLTSITGWKDLEQDDLTQDFDRQRNRIVRR